MGEVRHILNALIIDRVNIDDRGRVTLPDRMRKKMPLATGEEVEVRYIEGGEAALIQITKVTKK